MKKLAIISQLEVIEKRATRRPKTKTRPGKIAPTERKRATRLFFATLAMEPRRLQ